MPNDDQVTNPINHDLITKYFTEGDLPNLLNLFDFLYRQMQRAESITRAYEHQIKKLRADATNTNVTIREPKVRIVEPDTKPKTSAPTSAPASKSRKPIVEVDY